MWSTFIRVCIMIKLYLECFAFYMIWLKGFVIQAVTANNATPPPFKKKKLKYKNNNKKKLKKRKIKIN